jgi:hypothetical protein
MSRWHRNAISYDDALDFKRRLTVMFKALRSDHDFQFARQKHLCCSSCACYDIGTRSDERVKAGKPPITRWAFYHRQDADGIPDGGLHIAFGDSVDVGEAIRDAARDAGLCVSWDGTIDNRVFVMHSAGAETFRADKLRRADELAAELAVGTRESYDYTERRTVTIELDRDHYTAAITRLRAEAESLLMPVS